jgi:hypothetical protein
LSFPVKRVSGHQCVGIELNYSTQGRSSPIEAVNLFEITLNEGTSRMTPRLHFLLKTIDGCFELKHVS